MFKRAGHVTVEAYGALHAATGLAGEAGEVLDILKKHAFMHKPLDTRALILELGDVEFYLEALRQEVQVTRQEVLEANMSKLLERHSGSSVEDFYRVS
jgi:NTP pyrophosphatase (non-canonical NTP hydrolase)